MSCLDEMAIHSYDKEHGMYATTFHFHRYHNKQADHEGKLLLLHGIRLGGIETWEPIVEKLTGWSEILVPDLPCSGSLNPPNTTSHDFTLQQLLDPIVELIAQHQWKSFDLVGYSYGGFLSLFLARMLSNHVQNHVIIESALLVDAIENLHCAGKGLMQIAELMHYDPERGNQRFSENVYRRATRQFALVANTLKTANPLGFANLVQLLNQVYKQPVEALWELLEAQKNMTMLMTKPLSIEKSNMLDSITQRCPWKIDYIDNADHSVLFSEPHRIAKTLSQLKREWP